MRSDQERLNDILKAIQIIGMRNILAHEYFRVNLDRIWNVIEFHLHILKSQIEEILS